MSSNEWIMLAVAIVLAVFAGFIMAIEAAYQTMSVAKAERFLEEGRKGAKAAKLIADDPAPGITAATLLRIIFEIAASVLVSFIVFNQIHQLWAQITLSIVVLAIVGFTGWWVVPRTLGRLHDESLILGTAKFINVIATVLWPISQILIWISNAITPGPGWADGPISPEAEAIEQASEGEKEMIRSVFELGDTLVREVMVPRTDIVSIQQNKSIHQGLSLALRSGFSRIPVVGDDIDDVVGILYVKDAMKRAYIDPENAKSETVSQVMRAPSFVPDSKPIDEVMREMQIQRNHMVIVVDEFGGNSGLATIEDLIEEIVGEITDEYDAEPDLIEEVQPGLWRVSARMPIDDMGDLFGLELDDEDVETVGGLMAKQLNMVPISGAVVEWNGIRLEAERATARRHQIDTVLVNQITGSEDDQSDSQKRADNSESEDK